MLLKARPKPFVLDDATIVRTKRVNGEGLEWCDVYDRQLRRWRSERLTGPQRREVARLQGVSGELRGELARILELADELGHWPSQQAGDLMTDLQGHFAYQIEPGASRTITFTFSATSTLRGASATTTVLVAGKATIAAGATAHAGQALRLSGEIMGGYIPPRGTLIQLQYRIVGYPARMGALRRARPHPPQRSLEHDSPAAPRRRRTHLPVPRRHRHPERLALHPHNHQPRHPPRAHLTRRAAAQRPMRTTAFGRWRHPRRGRRTAAPARDRVGERSRVCDAAS